MKKFTRNDIILLQDFVNSIDNEITIAKSDRFECDIEEKQIFVCSKEIDNLDLQFIEWFKKQPEYTFINVILLSFLHEIGHIMTYEKERNDNRAVIESMLVFMNEQNAITEKEMNFAYWDLDAERLATMWGVKYFKNNRQKCLELAAAIGLC